MTTQNIFTKGVFLLTIVKRNWNVRCLGSIKMWHWKWPLWCTDKIVMQLNKSSNLHPFQPDKKFSERWKFFHYLDSAQRPVASASTQTQIASIGHFLLADKSEIFKRMIFKCNHFTVAPLKTEIPRSSKSDSHSSFIK